MMKEQLTKAELYYFVPQKVTAGSPTRILIFVQRIQLLFLMDIKLDYLKEHLLK